MPTPRRPKLEACSIYAPELSRPPYVLPLPLCALHLAPRLALGESREKMEASITDDKLNARREAIIVNGLPLLALSFQTLGMLYCSSLQRFVV